ncbi:hypothetical protein D3C77_493190 [compost metagenome]
MFKLLIRHQFIKRKMGLDFAKIHVNVALILTLDDAGNDILFLLDKSIVNQAPLSFTDALGHDLLGRLCSDASEITRRYFNLGDIIQLKAWINLASSGQRNFGPRIKHLFHDKLAGKNLNRPGMAIHVDTNVLCRVEITFVTGNQSGFNRFEQNIFADSFFPFQLI